MFDFLRVVIFLTWLSFILSSVILSFYGLITAFKVSVVMGLLFLVVEPAPLVQGALLYFFNYDLASKLQMVFHFPL